MDPDASTHMAETHWDDLRDEELRYQGHTWALTGDVDVRGTGEHLRARARQVDGDRHETAVLHFGVAGEGESLNPGNIGEVFARLEREGDRYVLVVKQEPRTYRYELLSVAYE